MEKPRTTGGYTLIELMVVVAVIAVIAAIAIPSYNGYIRESEFGAARANANTFRVFIEDFWLDNSTFANSTALDASCPVTDGNYNKAEMRSCFGWSPDGDGGIFDYALQADATSWSITVEHTSSGRWIRCENRMNNCCDSDTSGATTTACP